MRRWNSGLYPTNGLVGLSGAISLVSYQQNTLKAKTCCSRRMGIRSKHCGNIHETLERAVSERIGVVAVVRINIEHGSI